MSKVELLPDNYFIHKNYRCNTIPIISIPSDDDNIYEMNESAKPFIPEGLAGSLSLSESLGFPKPKINIFIYFNK